MSNSGKKKLLTSTSLEQSTQLNSNNNSGFLHKTLGHFPLFFANHNNNNVITDDNQLNDLSTSPKINMLRSKLSQSPPFQKVSSSTPMTTKKLANLFTFNDIDEHVEIAEQKKILKNQTEHGAVAHNHDEPVMAVADLIINNSPKLGHKLILIENKVQKKLKHQAFSLSSTFNAMTTATIQQSPLAMLSNKQSEKTVSTIKSGNLKQTTVVDTFSSKTTLLNSGLFLNRKKKNYKDHVHTKNVRRRSSTLNANLNLLTARNTLNECAFATTQFLKALDNISNCSTTNNSPIAEEKESFNSYSSNSNSNNNNNNNSRFPSVTSNLGVIVGVSDIKFRKKLLKLQQQQKDFVYASSAYLSTGKERRKKAFAAECLNYNTDESEHEDKNNLVVRRLSRAISDLVSASGLYIFRVITHFFLLLLLLSLSSLLLQFYF
jgi:hypothetical protein